MENVDAKQHNFRFRQIYEQRRNIQVVFNQTANLWRRARQRFIVVVCRFVNNKRLQVSQAIHK